MHHINERSRISINIKVNHYSLKRSYQTITQSILNQLIEQKLWQENCFGVRFVTLVLRERKINSKPRFENELELPLARSCLRLTHNFSLLTGWTGRNSTRTIFFRAWIRSIRLSLSSVVIKQSIFNAICNVQCGEYLI